MFDIQTIVARIKKTFTRTDILIMVGILCLFFVTRLIRLENFPIFSDEAIYIHWAKTAWHDAAWRFISLTDGKQPLQTWGTIPFLKLFPDNELVGGRLFSVFSGFLGLTGMMSLTGYLFGKRASFIGGLLYVCTPYFLFYDRMALVDSAVNASFLWILFLSIMLARTRRLDVSFLFGMIGGFGLLAKSSVEIFIGLASLSPILFFEKNKKKFFYKLTNFAFLYVIGITLALLIYNVQRLSPFLHFVAEKNLTFVMSFSDFVHHPFSRFFDNIHLIPYYTFTESGMALPFLGLIGLIFLYKKDLRLAVYLTCWIIIPFFMISFFSIVLFPRYMIFFGSLYAILASYLFVSLSKKTLIALLAGIYFISVVYFDYGLLFNPLAVPFPDIDRGQYVTGWTTGWGVKDLMAYARQLSADKPVIILAEGNFGMSGDVLEAYLKRGDNIFIRGYWPLGDKELRENQKELKNNHVLAVMSHQFDYPISWPIKLIHRYDKPGHQSVIYLFELTP